MCNWCFETLTIFSHWVGGEGQNLDNIELRVELVYIWVWYRLSWIELDCTWVGKQERKKRQIPPKPGKTNIYYFQSSAPSDDMMYDMVLDVKTICLIKTENIFYLFIQGALLWVAHQCPHFFFHENGIPVPTVRVDIQLLIQSTTFCCYC